MGKRGSITDLPFIIVGIFSVAVVALLVTLLVSNINTQVQGIDIFPTIAKTASTNMSDDLPSVMDGGIVFIFFAMVFVSLVLASLVPVHPIFLPFYILEWILLIWVGAVISNAYETIITINLMASVASQYQMASFFFQWFPYAVGIAGVVLAIVLYKFKSNIVGV